MDPPEVIYHYTSSAGLLGILETGTLWATDVRFLNDSQELTFSIPALLELLNAKANDLVRSADSAVTGVRLGGAATDIARLLADDVATGASQDVTIFAACFCEDGDLLGQWRGYAELGFSIGWSSERLIPDHLRNHEELPTRSELVQVAYGIDEARTVLAHHVDELAALGIGHIEEPGWVEALLSLRILARIKNPAFSEEREWRLLAGRQTGPAQLHFRSSPHGLAPYVAIPVDLSAIRTVVVGPGPHRKLRAIAAAELLRTRGSRDVDVRYSGVPYRPS